MDAFNLKDYGLDVAEVHRNLPPSALYEHAIRYDKDASIAENGALVAYSGAKTGRSPKDKRIVKNPQSENDVWWGPVNVLLMPALSTSCASAQGLSEHLRAAVLLRWLRRMGPELSHQGSRHLRAPLPRAVHAHHAHPPDARGAGQLRQARLRHLQRGPLPGQQLHRGHGFDDQHLPEP